MVLCGPFIVLVPSSIGMLVLLVPSSIGSMGMSLWLLMGDGRWL